MDSAAQDIFTLQIRNGYNVENPNLNCAGCTKGFVHINSLQVRKFSQTGRLDGVCRSCNIMFLRICRTQIKNLSLEKDEPKHTCTICQKHFGHAGNYKKHMLLHTPDPTITLQLTEISQTSADGESSQVVDDPESGPSEEALLSVLERPPVPHERPKPPYRCSHCRRTYLKYSSYLAHIDRHDNSFIYECSTCKVVFISKELLLEHVESHKEQHVCKVCKAVFSKATELEAHLLEHIQDQQNQLAGKAAKTSGGGFQKPKHFCSFCHKAFINIGCLKNHLNIHAGVYKYECRTCKKNFQYPTTFRKHKKQCVLKMKAAGVKRKKGAKMIVVKPSKRETRSQAKVEVNE